MQNVVDFVNFIRNLEPRHFFYLAMTSWLVYIVVRQFKHQRVTFGVLLMASAFTLIWLESQPGDETTKITELLKIIISWPLVILLIFLIFRARIDDLFRRLGEKLTSSTTTEVEIGDLKVKLDSPKSLGTVSAPTGESAKEEIVKLIQTETIQSPVKLPPGLGEIFVGQEAIFEEVSVNVAAGFVANEKGYVLTSRLNLSDGQDVFVRLSGEDRILPARMVKRSSDTFLTLLKLPQGTYPHLSLSKREYPDFGEDVFKVNIRSGVANGKVKTIAGIMNIQNISVKGVVTVEPALSQGGGGEGGSPVLDRQGKVIGVVFARSDGPSSSMSHIISISRIIEEFPILTE